MRPSYLLDSNVVIRLLAKDHPDHLEKAKKLFTRAEEGFCQLVLVPWIIAEVVYTLISFYKADKKQTLEALIALIHSAGIVTLDGEVVLDAMKRFRDKSVSFADALLAAQAAAMKMQPVSFDSDLDKFSDVKRVKP